jgi:triosephosphate isomerase (TIM)
VSNSAGWPRCVIAGNWKMYKTRRESASLVEAILEGAERVSSHVDLVVFPPFTALAAVADLCQGRRLQAGGQNFHPANEGAYTGEISARMLLEAGATHVLIGHSERRQHFREDDAFLARKLEAALAHGLVPVFCLGETLDEREAGRTEAVLRRQVGGGLGALRAEELDRLLVAYEPVWAIGTGRTATPDQAREAHGWLRALLRERWGGPASRVPLLYGGSVKPENAKELLSQADVDGVLIGGASLEAASFLAIAAAAPAGPTGKEA